MKLLQMITYIKFKCVNMHFVFFMSKKCANLQIFLDQKSNSWVYLSSC